MGYILGEYNFDNLHYSSTTAARFYAVKCQAPGSGKIISVTLDVADCGTGTLFKAGIYNDNSSSPGTFLGASEEITVNSSGVYTVDFNTSITVSKNDIYWIVIQISHPTQTWAVRTISSSDTGQTKSAGSWTYDTWPNNPSSLTTVNLRPTIYATIESTGFSDGWDSDYDVESTSTWNAQLFGMRFKCHESVTIDKASAYIRKHSSSGATECKIGLYSDDSNSPGTHLGHTDTISVIDDTTNYQTVKGALSLSLTKDTYYWIIIQANGIINYTFQEHYYPNRGCRTSSWIYDTWSDNPTVNFSNNVRYARLTVSKEPEEPVIIGKMDILVIAGGGGGGSNARGAGGGGAGGYVYETNYDIEDKIYSIAIGLGGDGGGSGSSAEEGSDGQNSVFDTLAAIAGGGGGRGGLTVGSGRNGGCGGGGGSGGTSGGGGAGTGSQGYNGGTGNPWTGNTANRAGGGGGGIGGAGQNGVSGGWGGGAGGSGTAYWGTTYATGGKGGDSSGTSNPPGDGAANTGNGGNGAGTGSVNAGGNGGSGVVVVRWRTADFGESGITGVGNTITTDGDYSFAKFIVNGTFTPEEKQIAKIDVNETLLLNDNVTLKVSKEVININESLILNDQNDIEEIIKKHKININESLLLSEDVGIIAKTFEEINVNETILLADDSNLNIPQESIKIIESLQLSDDIYTNVPLYKIDINESIILDDSSTVTVPAKYAKKILSYNPLIILSGDSEVQITHVDVSDPDNPVSTTYDVSGITNANDVTFNETNNYFYLCGSNGVIVKIDKDNLTNQTIINTGNSYNLLNNDSFDDFLRTYNITSNTDGELVVLDEREVKSLNTKIPIARLNAVKLDCYARTMVGKAINTDFRMSKLFTNKISTDIRVLKDEYVDLSQYPITRNDIIVKINDIDLLPLDDVDVQSIIITHKKDERSHASFVLHRKHDKPNFDNQGNASEITNQNNVKIYIDGHLEFDGKISGFQTYSETESIMVNAQMNEPSSSKTSKSLPLASVGEKLSLYHCLSRGITIDNPYIDPNDENPDFYLGIEVDLGTKIEENILRMRHIHSVHEEIEEGTFQPRQNWSYFWTAAFEKTFEGLSIFGNYSTTNPRYLGTSLGSLTTEAWRIIGAWYRRQKQFENTERELGLYRLGEAPYKEVSTRNGHLITKNKWADKADGLYREKRQSYNYVPYAKLVAELEYEKLKNINGDILPITNSILDLTVDGYYFYAIKLLNRLNLSNTTTPDIYKNQNGFPVAVKTITINTSAMKVSLECDNQLSIEELDDIDKLYPDKDDFVYPEESVLNFRKFDPNKWGYIY